MIIEKATELGMALSNSDEFRRLQAAKAAMDADKHVNELMEQYTQKQDKMVSMLENADSEGIEVSAIAKEIDDIQTELVENPVFEEMMEAQHCFANLMNEVNRTYRRLYRYEHRGKQQFRLLWKLLRLFRLRTLIPKF